MSEPEPSQNRRKHVRVYRHFMLTYFLVSNPTQQREVSQINNISQGGLSFSVTEPVEAGAHLGVDLKTPFLSEGIYLQGNVLECREKISKLIYEIRLEFKEISAQAKETLVKIEQYAHKES